MHDDEQLGREWISALADGQLDEGDVARAMAWVASSDDARATWHAYHVMGDVLRSADLTDCSGDRDFVARLRARLAQVEAGGEAAPVVAVAPARPAVPVVADATVTSANDAVVRWRWLAAAASLMAVSVLGWHLGHLGSQASAQLAAATPGAGAAMAAGATAAVNEPPVMLRDSRLDELLAAHRRFGGASALQTPAGFLRNATFEQPGR